MNKKTRPLTFKSDVSDAEDYIEQQLLKSLTGSQPQAVNRSFNVVAEDNGGVMVAGLTGSTAYGWLLIKTLWVAESYRESGVGTELMHRAETIAKQEGCHGAWLDTSSESAQLFYRKLGYEPFGQLENSTGQKPASHRRWFMKKEI